jgi:hypothetical protein
MRCETCRKVLAAEAFDDAQVSCRSCLSAPVPKPRKARASAVTTVRAASPEPVERRPLVGVAGSGDLEVRERRARRTALDALAQQHPEEFEQLLTAARVAEGLRT